MIYLRLKQSHTVLTHMQVFEQKLVALQTQVIECAKYDDTNTIEYILTENSKKLKRKVISLANTLFHPYLLRVGFLAYSPKQYALEPIHPIYW